MTARRMEDCLDMPLRDVLSEMQGRIMKGTSYFGVRTMRSPIDSWVYQQIIFERKPDLIIEIGNFHGGGVLALAHVLDRLGAGRVVGVDVNHARIPDRVKSHPRVTLIQGNATHASVVDQVTEIASKSREVLIIEDSAHTRETTLAILERYSGLISPGGYFIVEDGICNHGWDWGRGPGPYEAVEQFIAKDSRFVIDRAREAFFITWNPKGFLRRV